MIRMKNSRRIEFGLCNRAGVVQQLAQFIDGITHVGTQHVFAKELMEHLSDGAL